MTNVPILNCEVVNINPKQITLLTSKKSLIISNHCWEILKLCNGLNNITEIKEELKQRFEFDDPYFDNFIFNSIDIGIISLMDYKKKVDIRTIGSSNKKFPVAFSFAITSKCNLRCIYCYGDFNQKGIFFDFSKIEPLFLELSMKGVITLELSGGEPLMHPNFLEILELSLKYFFRVNIISNGVLFKDNILNLIQKERFRIGVQVSIDGCTEETNSKVRLVKNTWESTFRTIKSLRDRNINYRVVFMLTKSNFDELISTFELFKKEGLSNLAISLTTKVGRACGSIDCIDTQLLKTNSKYTNILEHIANEYKDIYYSLDTKKDNQELNKCAAGSRLAAISPNGDILACPAFGIETKLGNIFEVEDLYDIFNKENELSYSYYCMNRY